MKLPTFRTFLECLSFLLWIAFTIFSIALAGLSIEGIIFAALMISASSTQTVHFPMTMAGLGILGVFLSILWRRVGVDHFHYLQYEAPGSIEGEIPSSVLHDLIREVEESSGYARNDARAKAKAWLVNHVTSLGQEDLLLAKTHFGYLLPPEWGC